MNIIQFQDENYNKTVNELADSLKNNRLLALFGTGLTAGESTSFGKKIMLGTELQSFMIEHILKNSNEYSKSDFDNPLSFYDIADIFFEVMENCKIDVKPIFKEYFTNVIIDKTSTKYAFINLPWKTIYTLNVDDAIENHTAYTNVISPDMEINEHVKDYKSLIKLHGDAKSAICQNDLELKNSIVFSKDAYLKAILRNTTVLGYFVSELSSVHTLYYGCSFKTLEFDIETIIANEKHNILARKDTKRFYVTTALTENKLELRKLKNDFLITDIIVLKERKNYEVFMQHLVEKLHEIAGESHGFESLALKINFLSSEQKQENKAQLLMIENHKKITQKGNIFILPSFIINRDQTASFFEKINEKMIILLRGPRFSGKTLFLLNTFKDYGTREVYYFSSSMTLDTSVFYNLLSSLNRSILIFDTNSFSEKHIILLRESFHLLNKNDIKIIFTFNASNNITYGLFNNIFSLPEFSEVNLKNIFTDNELVELNFKLNQVPLPEFNNKIITQTAWGSKKSSPQNILDNIVRINTVFHNQNDTYIEWENYVLEKEQEFALLFMLLITEKVYTSQFYILYNNLEILQSIIAKYSPFIEEEYANIFEHEQHSGHKIIKNCHYCIKHIIKFSITNKNIKIENITEILLKLIDKMYKAKNKIYKEIMLFDNLNDIFDGKEFNNYANQIIETLYEKLENILTDDKHYWLQRAKSILYIANDNIDKINQALEYSTKIFLDSSNDYNDRVQGHASMTSAMLYGRLINLEKYSNIEHIKRAISFYIDTFTKYHWNTKYVQKLISRKGFNDLQNLIQIQDSILPKNTREEMIHLRKLVYDLKSEDNE